MSKFETKLKLRGNQFAALYTCIKRAENYYKNVANTGTDVSRNAPNIVYWRIFLGIKKRMEVIYAKNQNELVNYISLKFTDIETAALLNAIIPPENSSYNEAVIYELRNAAFKTALVHIQNINPAIGGLPVNTENNIVATNNMLTVNDAHHLISELDTFQIPFTITSFISDDASGRKTINYKTIEEALEDGNRLEPIVLQADEVGVFQVQTN